MFRLILWDDLLSGPAGYNMKSELVESRARTETGRIRNPYPKGGTYEETDFESADGGYILLDAAAHGGVCGGWKYSGER